jgi:hypothetical protein
MGTCAKINAGARLYRDSMVTAYSNIFQGTTIARISADANATICLFDLVQGPNSIVGRSGPSGITTVPGSWLHTRDKCLSAPNVDNIDPYHSFIWFGLVNGYLHFELFDGRPTTGVNWGSGADISITSSIPVPVHPVCCLVSVVADWPNLVGSFGTYTLYIDGVAVGSATTPPANSGVGFFFYDMPSMTVGTDKVNYKPQVHSVRVMNLRGFTASAYPLSLQIAEVSNVCGPVWGGDKFNYPFSGVTGLENEPSWSGMPLVLETGSTTIDLFALDCCPPGPGGDDEGGGGGTDPPPELTDDASGLYTLTPGKTPRNDTYYDRGVTPVGTINQKIPNPTIRTALFGE